MNGDLQAQRLLAREAQAAPPTQYSPHRCTSGIIVPGGAQHPALLLRVSTAH
jgi:hypothetical protein